MKPEENTMDENHGLPITYQLKKRIELLEKLSHEPQNYREKCEEMEKRIEVLEKKLGMLGDYTHLSLDIPEEITRDGDGKLLDIHGNEYDMKNIDDQQHDFSEEI